ncbi:tRNA (adenosine(37)-N6)-threonylcarbamoyltransferase complex dimerization subunit type 1 TsaB [Succiniclasticum ruminis]|uniref:tRNA threonylcarbamoyladenosine biosynthesis protein TsaB n=1 Tax=Succiniclasticum ruminis DSM 9236 TaxID=1123323 RepID=A0A1I2AWF1_9FIRM|nr:tRNA (adenosine(37)-N6)-threonylcarbamoyltransferase complex dimerization subunit type 1 TsaB [Succiniclasticum ruminis]SFE48047.1 tRNA threonylcarbamoyladenosine biosynthesis protein TsaB [Succiniclasticum ruminis DSM 9236]
MLTLALDTATRVCTVGLVQDGHVLAEYDISVGLTHSEGLMPQLDQMFARTGIKKENTDRIAVSIGPGSFTGLRIGLAAAEAMAYAWQCGICGVNTLEAMAYNIPVEGVVLVPVLDAQKGNFYAAFYEWTDGELRKVRPVEMADRETLLQQLQACGKPVLLMGECEKLMKKELPDGISVAPEQVRLPKASSVALAAEDTEPLTGEDVFTLRPYYIRKSEAEELWEKRHPQG